MSRIVSERDACSRQVIVFAAELFLIQLLERFCQDERVRIRRPQRHLQIKLVRSLSPGNEFVAYVDGIGYLDGTRCVLEWKTTSTRYRRVVGAGRTGAVAVPLIRAS